MAGSRYVLTLADKEQARQELEIQANEIIAGDPTFSDDAYWNPRNMTVEEMIEELRLEEPSMSDEIDEILAGNSRPDFEIIFGPASPAGAPSVSLVPSSSAESAQGPPPASSSAAAPAAPSSSTSSSSSIPSHHGLPTYPRPLRLLREHRKPESTSFPLIQEFQAKGIRAEYDKEETDAMVMQILSEIGERGTYLSDNEGDMDDDELIWEDIAAFVKRYDGLALDDAADVPPYVEEPESTWQDEFDHYNPLDFLEVEDWLDVEVDEELDEDLVDAALAQLEDAQSSQDAQAVAAEEAIPECTGRAKRAVDLINNTPVEDIRISFERDVLASLTVDALILCKDLKAQQRQNIIQRLHEIANAAHRTPTPADITRHRQLQQGIVDGLVSVATKNGRSFRGLIYPTEASVAPCIVSSNWATRECFQAVSGKTNSQMQDIESEPCSIAESVPLYCVDSSMTTRVNASRGLSPCQGAEFIDRYPCYAPAASTGSNPLEACGPGWKEVYLDGQAHLLDNMLEAGPTIELLSSKSAYNLVASLRSHPHQHDLFLRELHLRFELQHPKRASVSFPVLLYTRSQDQISLRNFSLIICDSAPIYQRHATMSSYARAASAQAHAFFRAWVPEAIFPILSSEQAHSGITATPFYGPSCLKDKSTIQRVSKAISTEAQLGRPLLNSEIDPVVLDVLECQQSAFESLTDAEKSNLRLVTPLQCLGLLFRLRAAATRNETINLLACREELSSVLVANPTVSVNDLDSRYPTLSETLRAFMATPVFKYFPRSGPRSPAYGITDVHLVYLIADVRARAGEIESEAKQNLRTWKNGPQEQSMASKAALRDFLMLHAGQFKVWPASLKDQLAGALSIVGNRTVVRADSVKDAEKKASEAKRGAAARADPVRDAKRKASDAKRRAAVKADPVRDAKRKASDAEYKAAAKADPVKDAEKKASEAKRRAAAKADPVKNAKKKASDAKRRAAAKADPVKNAKKKASDAKRRAAIRADPVKRAKKKASDAKSRAAAKADPVKKAKRRAHDAKRKAAMEEDPVKKAKKKASDAKYRAAVRADPVKKAKKKASDAKYRAAAKADPVKNAKEKARRDRYDAGRRR